MFFTNIYVFNDVISYFVFPFKPPFLISGGANDGNNAGGGNQFEVNFLVHSSQVGGVIGRAGSNIKELREVCKQSFYSDKLLIIKLFYHT